jgi:hypothetical protein
MPPRKKAKKTLRYIKNEPSVAQKRETLTTRVPTKAKIEIAQL